MNKIYIGLCVVLAVVGIVLIILNYQSKNVVKSEKIVYVECVETDNGVHSDSILAHYNPPPL